MDTIVALSSGSPPAAIGVIRVSGPQAGRCLHTLTGGLPKPRQAVLRSLREADDGLLDRALVLWFPGPHTATGEDLAEFHVHGGRAVVAAVIAALARIDGVRQAEPGEFTRRAFDNGAIDLLETEGLADLLSAETESQRRNAVAMAGGALGRQIAGWQTRLLQEAAMLEALIEFDEEDDVAVDTAATRARIGKLAEEIDLALERPAAERLKDGIRVVIAGPPNAGKSTLLNAIVGRDVAITSPIAGTTRDVIEAPVTIQGLPFLFTDTAGLRETTEDQIERVGIRLAGEALDTADIVVWLGAPGDAPRRANVILVHPRCDADGRAGAPPSTIAVSAVTFAGFDELMGAITAFASALLPKAGDVALNRRQREILQRCTTALKPAAIQPDTILAAEHLRAARVTLDELTGKAGTENMLDTLFSRFCLGK